MIKHLTLCADDYGLNHEMNDAILSLAATQNISAITSLVTFPQWQQAAVSLQQYVNHMDLGLHFNLTEGYSSLSKKSTLSDANGKFNGLKKLYIKCYLGLINPLDVKHELLQQLELYVNKMQRLPDFIDGHQHVHQLPLIQKVLFEVYESSLRTHNSYIRVAVQHDVFNIKAQIIAWNGGVRLQRQLKLHNIPHNQHFSGIYNFNNAHHYPHYFRKFLKTIKPSGLIMCHPGLSGHRIHEWNYLKSLQFKLDSEQHHIHWDRFKTI